MGKELNPINADEQKRKANEPARVLPQLTTDKFSPEEQKDIVRMVMDDAQIGLDSRQTWLDQKRKDILHLNSAPPTQIENLIKKSWMSDRNLGLCAGVLDIYQATLLATCYNPDSIHFKDTEQNDVDNKDNLEKFSKWVLSDAESKAFPEIDDFINNRVALGFSLFKIYWEVVYRWVDKRIPKFSKDNKKRIVGYDIVTERQRFERGVIKNVDQLDDILIPEFGKAVQDLKFLIEILHITSNDLSDLSDRGVIINYNEKKFSGLGPPDGNKLRVEDEQSLGTTSQIAMGADAEKRNKPVDIYEWYGWYEKDKKYEQYVFLVEPKTWTFLSGKPLRKINRSGKIPFVGGPLRRRPGFLRGGSLTTLIAPAINALNNNYNQTSDFQYFENCPEGYYNTEAIEIPGQTIEDVEPGKMTGVSGDPNKLLFFPNRTRSLAWSYQDKQFLMEIIERLTGAASYFLTSSAQSATATRDNIVEQKGEVKFGLWVKRIQTDIAEAVNMLIQLYQDWAPPNLVKRVMGENGKAIIKNLSINSLRGNYDAYMVPDITSGSKAYERQTALWAFQVLQQGSIWLAPQVNPRGNWLLTKYVMQKQGIENPEHYLPPQPKEQGDYNKEAEEHFNMMIQGDTPEPPGADTPQIVECLATMLRLKEDRGQDLDQEYKPLLEQYLFKAFINYSKFMKNVAQEQAVMRIAANAAGNLERLGITPQAPGGPQPAQAMPTPGPGGNNASIQPKPQQMVAP